MPTDVRLPALDDSVKSAKLVSWLAREGDLVASGQPIAEVETDKATIEIEAPVAGVLGAILVRAGGDAVPIGTLLTVVLDGTQGLESAPPTPKTVREPAVARKTPLDVAPSVTAVHQPVPPPPAQQLNSGATPLAARMASFAALDLTDVPRAHDGRITKTEIELALQRRRAPGGSIVDAAPQSSGAVNVNPSGAPVSAPFSVEPLSAMRRVTAERLQEAKRTVPHFYLQTECRVDTLMALRAQLNSGTPAFKLTVTDLIVFAAAQALRKVPQANSAWIDGAVRIYASVDIAVAVNTTRGLITPIVRQCERKSLEGISREVKQLSERAREGHLKPNEYTGGTFTISNLGMFGVTTITPIVNPPQSCILGVGAIEQRPVVVNGRVDAGLMLSCTLAADHRAIDGAVGAEFLSEIRRLLENPAVMALRL